MTLKQAQKILTAHNKWRRGGKGKMTDPKLLGQAIEVAVIIMKDYGKIYNIDKVQIHPESPSP